MAKIPPHIVLKSPASITLKFRSPQLPRSFTTSEKGQHIVFQVTRVAASARRGRKCRAAAKSPPELVTVEGVRLRYRGWSCCHILLPILTHPCPGDRRLHLQLCSFQLCPFGTGRGGRGEGERGEVAVEDPESQRHNAALLTDCRHVCQ